jgi:hypothetical protein
MGSVGWVCAGTPPELACYVYIVGTAKGGDQAGVKMTVVGT